MSINEEFERSDSSNLICPYCDHEMEDAWEFKNNEGVEECSECGKKFQWERVIDVDYKTSGQCELNNETHVFLEVEVWYIHEPDESSPEDYLYGISQCKKCSKYEIKRKPRVTKNDN